MRRHLSATVACLVLLISACVDSTLVVESDLQHHRWILESINGEPLPEGESSDLIPELDFGEQMHVSGNTGCNRFTGSAVLRDEYFRIDSMASTRRLCAPAQNELERTVQNILGQESTILLGSDKSLTLESSNTVLRFRLRDWVQ
jgi:heat shock protein HslJ